MAAVAGKNFRAKEGNIGFNILTNVRAEGLHVTWAACNGNCANHRAAH